MLECAYQCLEVECLRRGLIAYRGMPAAPPAPMVENLQDEGISPPPDALEEGETPQNLMNQIDTQLQCISCETILAYPSHGTRDVICPVCRASNRPTECSICCPRCGSDLAYPAGSTAIICGACDITLKPENSHRGPGRMRRAKPPKSTTYEPVIIVHNPNRMQANGKLCPDVVLAKLVHGPLPPSR